MTKEIAILKKLILETKEISHAINYFFDLVGEREEELCKEEESLRSEKEDPEFFLAVKAALHAVSNRLKRNIQILSQKFIRLKKEKFYHGYCTLLGVPAPVLILYCSDYQIGVAAVSMQDGNSIYVRFSLMVLDEKSPKH